MKKFRSLFDPLWAGGLQSSALTCWGVSAMALFLRLHHLGSQSLWLDEVLSVQDASHPFLQIPRQVLASPPLFHYIIRLFYLHFGNNDYWLRFPAVLFGTLAVPIFYSGLLHFSNARTAFLGALFLALSPAHIAYSQELRMYSLGSLEVLMAVFCFERALEHDRLSDWVGMGVANLLGLYTHNWFIFFTASQAMGYVLWIIRQRPRRSIGALTFCAIALFYAPWIPVLVAQSMRPVFGYLSKPGWSDVRDTFFSLLGIKVTVGDCSLAAIPWMHGIFIALGVLGLGMGMFLPGQDRKRLNRLFILGSVAPLVMAFVFSLLFKPIYLPSRYPVLGLPCFLIPLVRGVSWGQTPGLKRLGIGMGLAWLIFWSVTLGVYYRQFAKGEWKAVANWMVLHARAGDAVWLGPLGTTRLALEYYLPGDMTRVEDPLSEGHPHLFVPYYNSENREYVSPLGPRMSRLWKIEAKCQWRETSVLMLSPKK